MAKRATKLKVADEEHLAELQGVAEFAENLPEEYLRCRELGHNWSPFKAGPHPDGGWERVLRCPRCRTRRHQSLSAYGMVLTNRYEYPEGYLTENMGPIVGEGRGLLRVESIKRIIDKKKG